MVREHGYTAGAWGLPETVPEIGFNGIALLYGLSLMSKRETGTKTRVV